MAGSFKQQLDNPGNAPQAGQNIGDDTSTLYAMLGLSATEGATPVLLARPRSTGQKREITVADTVGAEQPDVMTPEVKKSLGQTIQGFYNLDDIQRSQVQRRLLSGGFYASTNNLLAGQPDDDTLRAFATAARRSVVTGKTLDETIDASSGAVNNDDVNKLLSSGGAGAGGKAARAPFSPTVTNPLDIRDTAQSVASKTLGRKFSDAELARFVATYQQMETGSQQQNYTATTAGGTTTQAPTVAAAAEAQARQAAPVEAGAHDLASVYSMFAQILGGTGTAI